VFVTRHRFAPSPNSGSVFASLDEGERWHEIARHLPTILSIETVGVYFGTSG
jgi:hypothetical protein